MGTAEDGFVWEGAGIVFCLEELTQNELINWIRENVPDLDEGKIVLDILRQRQAQLREIRDEANSCFWETNKQIEQLVEQYADGPVKPGVRLRSWPAAAQQEYKRLDQIRQEARNRGNACCREDNAIGWKIIAIQKEQIKEVYKVQEK